MTEPTHRSSYKPVKYEAMPKPLHDCDGMGGVVSVAPDGTVTTEWRECSVCAPIDRENQRRQYAVMGVGKF